MHNFPTRTLAVESLPANQIRIPLSEIESAIRAIRHGAVQIIIQDGKVVQIDTTEKMRLR